MIIIALNMPIGVAILQCIVGCMRHEWEWDMKNFWLFASKIGYRDKLTTSIEQSKNGCNIDHSHPYVYQSS